MLGPNQWPDFPGFQETVKSYYDAIYALSTRLFRGFALARNQRPSPHVVRE